MRRAFALAAAALVCASAAQAGSPLLITQHGIAGVRPGLTLAQVKQRLAAGFAGAQYGSGLDGAVCRDGLHADAGFAVRSDIARLRWIAFTAGVVTANGIRPGSTLRQLERAYGKRLVLDDDPDIHAADSDVVRPSGPHAYDLVFTVDVGTHRVLAIGLNGGGGVLGVHCPTAFPPPATIGTLGLGGASGLQPTMPQEQVLRTWPWFPFLTEAGGSGFASWMPVCADPVRGLVGFGGRAFANVWFNSGAATDTGITIGSTLDDLRATYGADLSTTGAGEYQVFAPGGPPTATVAFQVQDGLVTSIGFGGRQSIGSFTADRIWC